MSRAQDARDEADEWHRAHDDLMAEARRLYEERAADRAAVRALVASMPRCEGAVGESCSALATRTQSESGPMRFCEEHGDQDLAHAAALRALLARMATWDDDL